jgi:uncharacterized C2H2 Zn-finger protein
VQYSGHHARHLLTHLPNGIGYYVKCPACNTVMRREDTVKRHYLKMHAKKGQGALGKEALNEAMKENIFIR